MIDLLLGISSYIEIHNLELSTSIALFITIALLLCSGFASGSEIAFFSLTPRDLDKIDLEKSAVDVKVNNLRNDSERTLATILILNTLLM